MVQPQPPMNPVDKPDVRIYYRPTEQCASDENTVFHDAYADFSNTPGFITIYSRVSNKPLAYFNKSYVVRVEDERPYIDSRARRSIKKPLVPDQP